MIKAIASTTQTIFGNSPSKENNANMTSVDSISISQFRDALGRYPALLKTFSKPRTDGGATLEELDRFRYIDAPSRFSKKAGGKTLELADVQKLVDWKLRHGTFRPTLPKLVAKNSDDTIKAATQEAFSHYAKNSSDIAGTLKLISEPLKGVGPATASLLLAVHDPEQVIFFSDEVYRWLVAGGNKISPKYTAKEFEDIHAKVKSLQAKLKVSPIDIEKVAFVIIKENEPVKVPKPKPVPSGRSRGRPALPESEKKPKKPTVPGRGRGRPPGATKKEPKAPKTPNGTGKRGRPSAAKTEEAEATPKSSTKRKAADETPGTARSKKSKA